MSATQYDIGDMVFAAEDILNDGGMPGIDEEEGLIAPAGARPRISDESLDQPPQDLEHELAKTPGPRPDFFLLGNGQTWVKRER